MKMLGVAPSTNQKEITIDEDEMYNIAIKTIQDATGENTSKAMNNKELAYSEPILGNMSANPDFKSKPYMGGGNLHQVLKSYSNNIILNSIINTRSNQASMFCRPSRYSEKGVGFQVRLKDLGDEPNRNQQAMIKRIEKFILNTGEGVDVDRDSFTTFVKKLIRDTYRYDQVNFEKVFDQNGKFIRFVIKDPSTIFFATDSEGKLIKNGHRYVQVLDNKVVAKFTSREMAFSVRNPRSDIEAAGYGYSELEVAMRHFIAHENTEVFNDRFFSHGGTTRGILQIKADETQSQHALDMFKREWKNTLSGINGSWQIPVVSAEDVKFVNMTPTARDMEFEKWLNYLINVISSVYGIDPAEINFPNNGGATGSKGASLNEGNSAQKMQASQNKGLLPLLEFISDTINKHIITEFGDDYVFQFVGGDVSTELQKIEILKQKAEIGMTVNELREELGLAGEVVGGDVPLSGVIVQRIGQLMQQDQFEYSKQQDRISRLMEQTSNVQAPSPEGGLPFQDVQQGINGDADTVNGKETTGRVGKDGQSKDLENTNSAKQGGQGDD